MSNYIEAISDGAIIEPFEDLPFATDEEAADADIEISYLQPVYHYLPESLLEKRVSRDIEIFQENLKAFNERPANVAREGDFVERLDGRLERVVHVWPNCEEFVGKAQTYEWSSGSFYLGKGYVSHSGSCDPGVELHKLVPTGETRLGSCWIFSQNLAGAGRGVTAHVRFRVFKEAE